MSASPIFASVCPLKSLNHSSWVRLNLLLTRGVFLVILQDSDPPIRAVIGDGGTSVPPGVVLVLHPLALPLLRGDARLGSPHRHTGPDEAEGRGGQEDEQQSVHVCSCEGSTAQLP